MSEDYWFDQRAADAQFASKREPARAETLIRDHAFTGADPDLCSHYLGPQGACGAPSEVHAIPQRSLSPEAMVVIGGGTVTSTGVTAKQETIDILTGEDPRTRLPVRRADAAQYTREPIPEPGITVRLLNATPDPLGSIAALGKQYKGEVVRNLSEVTDEERRQYFEDFGKTVLNGPLEAAQFHFQIEGVTRSITHQMVRSRASFFAQESLRFAVPEGNWAEEIPLPPSLQGKDEDVFPAIKRWKEAIRNAQESYASLLEWGVPAEEARGVLPHDMPTRIHWVCDLRTLLTEAGKRTCTQAQFPWRVIFAGIAKALREWGGESTGDGWQFHLIADRLRPYCFQSGSCGFMAQFDRGCSIRERVEANAKAGRPPSEWGRTGIVTVRGEPVQVAIQPIRDWEWAADPGAART